MLYRYLNVVYPDLESLADALVAQGHTQPVDVYYKPTDTIADVIVIPVVESATEQAERLAQKLHQPVQAWIQSQDWAVPPEEDDVRWCLTRACADSSDGYQRARHLERNLGCRPDQNLVQILSTK